MVTVVARNDMDAPEHWTDAPDYGPGHWRARRNEAPPAAPPEPAPGAEPEPTAEPAPAEPVTTAAPTPAQPVPAAE
ncbi:hypothetical protein ABTY59_32345, partial [Streptomyces sp. NPDC096079]|uniref:hypothetical protein n=1 Tax=Streptomyces sp. NPDC096079 TaxID=3155820 RepID=UPI003329F28F